MGQPFLSVSLKSGTARFGIGHRVLFSVKGRYMFSCISPVCDGMCRIGDTLGKFLLAEEILHTLTHVISGTSCMSKLRHLTFILEISLSDFNWIMYLFLSSCKQ